MAKIDNLIKPLTRPDNSPLDVETHLDALAAHVHCWQHDDPRNRWSRINVWLAAMPESLRQPTLQRQLRNELGPTLKSCICIAKTKLRPCGNDASPKSAYSLERTIDKMIQIATVACDGEDTLDDLASDLQYFMMCSTHQKHITTSVSQQVRELAIDRFREACWLQKAKGESKSADPGITPPSTPRHRKPGRKPCEYWNGTLDTSKFNILGKGDILDDGTTPNESVYNIARESLKNKKGENEVNDGRVYIFTVPGNDGFVKIGFTTQEGAARENQWKESCNREPKMLYKSEDSIPHAHRVERLVHADLMEHRVRIFCKWCQHQHTERFEVSAKTATDCVTKWSLWILRNPYEGKMTDNSRKWFLKEDDGLRTSM